MFLQKKNLQVVKVYTVGKKDFKERSIQTFSRHFNSSNHSISDFAEFGLSVINGGNDYRKTKEMRLIHAFGTLKPHRKNERFTFC